MSEYKVGDVVEITVHNPYHTDLEIGDRVTLARVNGGDYLTTEPVTQEGRLYLPWSLSSDVIRKVNMFKVGDKVTPTDDWDNDVLTVEGVSDTHVWASSDRERQEGYEEPYYTYPIKGVKAYEEPTPVWKVGKHYVQAERGLGAAVTIEITAVDEDGYAQARTLDKNWHGIKFPNSREFYKEVDA